MAEADTVDPAEHPISCPKKDHAKLAQMAHLRPKSDQHRVLSHGQFVAATRAPNPPAGVSEQNGLPRSMILARTDD